jgi:hypothetical protein
MKSGAALGLLLSRSKGMLASFLVAALVGCTSANKRMTAPPAGAIPLQSSSSLPAQCASSKKLLAPLPRASRSSARSREEAARPIRSPRMRAPTEQTGYNYKRWIPFQQEPDNSSVLSGSSGADKVGTAAFPRPPNPTMAPTSSITRGIRAQEDDYGRTGGRKGRQEEDDYGKTGGRKGGQVEDGKR